jgi:hypothetical protein
MSGHVRISPVNPLDHAQGIVDLFRDHETPQFAAYFNRVYPGAVAEGARSWIGLSDGGEVVMHMACFVNRFVLDGSLVRGGQLANFMVAASHRTVTPALSLVRQLVREAREFGDLDLLYTNPNAASHAVLRLGGLQSVAEVERFVYPTGDDSPALHVATGVYGMIGRLRARTSWPRTPTWRPADDPVGQTPPDAGPPGHLTPLRTRDQLARRLAGFPAHGDRWLVVEGMSRPRAAFLTGPSDVAGAVDLHASWTEVGADLWPYLPHLAAEMRRNGARRLTALGLRDSALSRDLERGGFKARGVAGPLDAVALTPLGTKALADVSRWDLHAVDLDGSIA